MDSLVSLCWIFWHLWCGGGATKFKIWLRRFNHSQYLSHIAHLPPLMSIYSAASVYKKMAWKRVASWKQLHENGRKYSKNSPSATVFVHYPWRFEEKEVPLRHKLRTNNQDGMNKLFIGREKEQQRLKEYLNSEQSEFIVSGGRGIWCIRGTGNLIRFKPSYDYRGWSSGRLSMIIFSRNAFHKPLQLQYYSRKIQVHSYGTPL